MSIPASPNCPSLLISYPGFLSPHISMILCIDKEFKYIWLSVLGYQSNFWPCKYLFFLFSLQPAFEIKAGSWDSYSNMASISVFKVRSYSYDSACSKFDWRSRRNLDQDQGKINPAWHLCLHSAEVRAALHARFCKASWVLSLFHLGNKRNSPLALSIDYLETQTFCSVLN